MTAIRRDRGRWAPYPAVALAGGALLADVAFDPLHRHVPLCPFHAATGLQCPLCGGLRSVQALAGGHVAAAFHANALFIASLPMLLLLWLDAMRRARDGRPRRALPRWAAPALVAVALVFTVVRNLPGEAFLRPVP